MAEKIKVHAQVLVRLKKGLLDPQGKAVQGALNSLGYKGATKVRVGKLIELEMEGENTNNMEAAVQEMCQKLLSNPVIEDFEVKILTP